MLELVGADPTNDADRSKSANNTPRLLVHRSATQNPLGPPV